MNEKNILLVDDEVLFCEMVQEYLTCLGCNVTVAENGSRAYEQTRVKRFDLVLMDINMPKMDGIEAIRAMRERQPRIPIILMSGDMDHRKINEALSQGATAFLKKPFALEELQPLVAS
jgi:two-component system response regulator AtoC